MYTRETTKEGKEDESSTEEAYVFQGRGTKVLCQRLNRKKSLIRTDDHRLHHYSKTIKELILDLSNTPCSR